MSIITQRVPGLKQGADWRGTITWPEHPQIVLEPSTDRVYAKVVEYKDPQQGGGFGFTDAITHAVFTNKGDVEKLGGFVLTPNSLEIIFSGEQTLNWRLRALGKTITRVAETITLGEPPDTYEVEEVSLVFPKSILNVNIFIVDANGSDRMLSGFEYEFEMEASTSGIGTPGLKVAEALAVAPSETTAA